MLCLVLIVQLVSTKSRRNIPRLVIVDGQQRLTSLYAVLKNAPVKRDDYTDSKISIAFRPRDGIFEVTDARRSRMMLNIYQIYQNYGLVRCRGTDFVREFIDKLRRHRVVCSRNEEEDRLTESIDRLYDLQNYPFTFSLNFHQPLM